MAKVTEKPFSESTGRRAAKEKIHECHQKWKGIDGYRRVRVWLKLKYNLNLNHKRVQRLMREMGIRAVSRKKKPYYGKKRTSFQVTI
jgi:putative transposase